MAAGKDEKDVISSAAWGWVGKVLKTSFGFYMAFTSETIEGTYFEGGEKNNNHLTHSYKAAWHELKAVCVSEQSVLDKLSPDPWHMGGQAPHGLVV